ncbi:MAG: RNA polymerase sigma-70 factor [Solirubrobacteraceae bacterium]
MAEPPVTELRPLMLSIAYRMVGSFSEAEDLVQEAYLRLHQEEVANPKAWLTTVTTRLAIDHLKSARVRREQYTGTWLPEPVLADPAPGAAERAETLSLAFLVVLESLSPVERAVFLLRDVFDYGYEEIAEIVGKSAANCRQLAVRARRHVEAREPRFEASRTQRDELGRRFLAAVREGETEPLIELLAEDVAFYGDGGGKAPAIPRPLHGRERVARFVLGLGRLARRQTMTLRPVEVNGQPGVLALDAAGHPIGVLSLDIADGTVHAIRSVVNPEKLTHISSTILPSLPPDLKRS